MINKNRNVPMNAIETENCSRAEAQQCQVYQYRSIFAITNNKC
jgi:hypothetical protein